MRMMIKKWWVGTHKQIKQISLGILINTGNIHFRDLSVLHFQMLHVHTVIQTEHAMLIISPY